MFKIGEIRELIRLLDETSVAELKVETDDMKFLIKKADVPATPVVVSSTPSNTAPAPVAVPAAAAPSTPAAAPAAPAADAPLEQDENVHFVTSPMVGTFYRAPAPDAPPYVEPGTKVNPKSVVCIVEAMKLMNEIEAEVSGEVLEVLVDNGQLVEYGQPLIKIRRA
ncbi:acetyl-CoA carboxylase biotin carboxyl carrier protein [Alicyclobacillus cycloheptanicus]|uniref:Biotin carboxyl carrier protein of acetyl-CoA carboxylase n=1 Tax=Alicyclobacillus cycloheptanicus TaxID=1457 RepID=A0ABT9XDV0_9BACL|nr:acetyl-CoA carboxylase biotin carboxyl carrier protein [Alicyclobacillus cycloheptanicus]MDQ0188357.1 acetyl-CoA carboxylase biotin carboxyl carrier protein [Alicyclobacillus cycloheptanicus]WDM01065.1 acetyl-CoA carboxylase biotin carboxyl carrier protein [Alicyclobacillus cycloheptanicus]